METIYFLVACISIMANMALLFCIIVLSETIKKRFNDLMHYIDKQSELLVIISRFLRQNDERQNVSNIIAQKIQDSIREFNKRMSLNVVDDDKPLEFPNDEK